MSQSDYNRGFRAGHRAKVGYAASKRKLFHESPNIHRPPEQPLSPDVCPTLIERACGGYLAISPLGYPLKIGVTGETKAETLENFALAYARWLEILTNPEYQSLWERRVQGNPH